MSTVVCCDINWIQLSSEGTKFFGFSEFLAGLALMILAWTTADIRYRFRIDTAPIPMKTITFSMVLIIGLLTILTDLWRAEEWYVPKGTILTPYIWQSILAGLFFITFLTWAWFAFIKPPLFSKRNAKRYAQTLFKNIVNGSITDLSIIADELKYSIKNLVKLAPDKIMIKQSNETNKQLPDYVAFANDIFLLLGDKRFCRAVITSSPSIVLEIFNEINQTKKYSISIKQFAKNIVNEAINNKDSFLFHETEGYETGLIGYVKPFSHAMFGNYRMVEEIATLLDPNFSERKKWDQIQWEAYCRIILITFKDYVDNYFGSHSSVLHRATGYIVQSVSNLYLLNGTTGNHWDEDPQGILRVVVKFIQDAIHIMNDKEVPCRFPLRRHKEEFQQDFYDVLALMIFEIINSAADVQEPENLCWWIQHNMVWAEFFKSETLENPVGKKIKFKIRRLIYDEIVKMEQFPNFKGAKVLGFCLNVFGLELKKQHFFKDGYALHKVSLAWVQKKFIWLYSYNPEVAEACLVDGIIYDKQNKKLVKTYHAKGLRRETTHISLELEN